MLYFLGIDIHASYIDAKLGKACSGNKSHIPRANNGNVHSDFLLIPWGSNQNLRVTRSVHVTRKVVVECRAECAPLT
jgi:hypothetical protein